MLTAQPIRRHRTARWTIAGSLAACALSLAASGMTQPHTEAPPAAPAVSQPAAAPAPPSPVPPAHPAPITPATASVPAVSPTPVPSPAATAVFKTLQWMLNNPTPNVTPEHKTNPTGVADKPAFKAQRSGLRAFEGAPPVIPHPIADLKVQTCRACHDHGVKAGPKVAGMAPHPLLTNCTQCHVESASPMLDAAAQPLGFPNTFVGRQVADYRSTRAFTGAPPVMPHSLFMRTNCVSCHGSFGSSQRRPAHLSRTNCFQCHASGAEFEQLAPTFNQVDVADGGTSMPKR